MPVNVVLLGYDPAAVDAGKLVAGLPRTGRPIHRLPTRLGEGAGKPASTLGIEYTFDYRVHDTDRGYEDRFFAMLRSTGQRKPLTEAQQEYNGQKRRSATVTSNLEIDARAVERYLALRPPAGVDTRRHTVFLVNWWGRKDFRFHEYAATGDPDPDTGVDADTDGDGTADYRIPPAWEYRRGGYRAASALTADLAKLVRYAAVDVQFASSPGSFAQPAAYGLVRAITIDVTTYRGTTKLDDALDTDRLRDAVQRLNPLTPVTVRHRTAAFDARNRRCYELLMTEEEPKACPGSPAPEQNLFSYHHRQGIRPRVDAAGTLTVPCSPTRCPTSCPSRWAA